MKKSAFKAPGKPLQSKDRLEAFLSFKLISQEGEESRAKDK